MNWAMHLLGELRRNRRSKLKKKCYPKDALKEDVYENKPSWADEQDYRALVDYWFDPKTKVALFSCSIFLLYTEYSVLTNLFVLICWRECVKDFVDTNKRSRSFQTDIARTGPISFAQTADNMVRNALYNN